MLKKHPLSESRTRQPKRTTPDRTSSAFQYRTSRLPRETVSDSVRRAKFKAKPPKPSRRYWWRNAPVILAAIILLLYSGDALLLNTNPKIVPLSDPSVHIFLHSTTVYQQAAEQLLALSFMNRNKLTIDSGGISRAFKQQFPELTDVSVTLPLFGHQPVIYIAPDTPALILASQNGGTFIVANSGKALLTATNIAQLNNLKLPVVIDKSGLAVQIGQPTVPVNDIKFVLTVFQQFQAQKIPTMSLTLPPATSELDVQITGESYFVKFNLQNDAKQQIGAFVAVQSYLKAHNATAGQYIDVRVPDRVFYK